jgi:hypothetical protein
MPEWIIIEGSINEPRCKKYASLDDALLAWDHLRLSRHYHHEAHLHDVLAMIVDEKEYPACQAK